MPSSRAMPSGALDVWYKDEEIDAMYNSLFRELLTYMMEDPRNIGLCTHLLFGAKNIERVGDHATNIAETVYYLVHGRPITGPASQGRYDQSRRRSHRRPGRRRKRCLQVNGMNAGAKVLVVEDEEPLALLLRYNLEAEGYAVDVVHRGDEAEVAIAESSPDLIVLDWMLPGLSGLELCRRLRMGKESRTIPDHPADGAERGERPDSRPHHWRRRLCGQAVFAARTDGSGPRYSTPHESGAHRHGVDCR